MKDELQWAHHPETDGEPIGAKVEGNRVSLTAPAKPATHEHWRLPVKQGGTPWDPCILIVRDRSKPEGRQFKVLDRIGSPIVGWDVPVFETLGQAQEYSEILYKRYTHEAS